jgi:hypothetical protein
VINSVVFSTFKPALRKFVSLSKWGCLIKFPVLFLTTIFFSIGNLRGQPETSALQIVVTNYNGWTNAIVLGNGLVEAVIVPDAGRVMQFRFAGSVSGPFWENPKLFGKTSANNNWITAGAFGGDKSWPAPQSDWRGGWPPPTGFDGNPYACEMTNGSVTITSVIDSDYKIQVTRTIDLAAREPVMRIKTFFRRFDSAVRTNAVAPWVITQVSDPAGIFVPVPSLSIFAPADYHQLGSGLPAQFTNADGLISFTRDAVSQRHLGFAAGSLAWVGKNLSLRIDAPRVPGLSEANYPNGGSSTVVYTNPDSAPYAELEFFGPLTNLLSGQMLSFTTTYTLFSRTGNDPETEGRKILGLPAR